jgi:hypothetical protein
MLMRSSVANHADIDRRVKEVARKLGPDVAWIRYARTLDSTGEESIYFRIGYPIRRAARGGCAPLPSGWSVNSPR